jgi:hypothetical protein
VMCRDAINCKTGYGQRWPGSRRQYPDSERAVEVKHRKTLDEYRLSAEKLDREYADVPATPSNVRQGPGPFVGKLSSFETNNVIPIACGNFGKVNKTASPRKSPRVLTTASWFPLLRVPSSGTISSSLNGAGPCLLLLLVGLRPSSSAAFPSSGRQWLPLLRPPKRRAILLHCVSGTARHGIV